MTDPITTPEQMREAVVLLPCPFCGGQADLFIETGGDYADCTVTCRHCSAETFARVTSQDETHDALDAAVADWNRRAIPIASQSVAKYGNRNVPKMIREIEKLRQAIRAEGSPAVQEAWDAVEEHIDFAYRTDTLLDQHKEALVRLANR